MSAVTVADRRGDDRVSDHRPDRTSRNAPDASDAFRAFNGSDESNLEIGKWMIDTEARDRFHDETYQYTQQQGLKFKATPDEIADDLKEGVDEVDMYMSESKPGLLCIDVIATTIDHGMIENDEMGIHPPDAAHTTFVKVTCELYGRFSASTEMFDMSVTVKQHELHDSEDDS